MGLHTSQACPGASRGRSERLARLPGMKATEESVCPCESRDDVLMAVEPCCLL